MSPRRTWEELVGLVHPKKTVQVLSVLIPVADKRTALCIENIYSLSSKLIVTQGISIRGLLYPPDLIIAEKNSPKIEHFIQ